MSKRKKKVDVLRISAEEVAKTSLAYMHNGWCGGYGAHGSRKYDRNKEKRRWNKENFDGAKIFS